MKDAGNAMEINDMAKAQLWTIVAVVAVVILGTVGWIVWNKSSDGSTKIENPTAPDASAIAQPVPGQEVKPAAGTAASPQMDAQGGAVVH